MAFDAEDIRWMHSALSLSKRGLGRVWPNPAVGCIIVRDGVVRGRGVTAAGGRPHAEAAALQQAGPAAKGATAYVTLEPCARPGRDQSCADKLIAAGVSRVVAAITDPNPQVNGQGLAKLQAAGIVSECGLLEDAARDIHAGFFARVTRNRPLVALKLATSLDGKIATASGESRWITGEAAHRAVHLLRSQHDAVMTGIGTVLADNPMLDVRDLGITAHPVRLVLDTQLRLPPASRLVQSARARPLWVIHAPAADGPAVQVLADLGVTTIVCPTGPDGRLNLKQALVLLAERGLTRVLCEGGAALAAALITGNFADRLVTFSAGKIIGAEGLSAVGAIALHDLALAPAFRLVRSEIFGAEVMTVWQRRSAARPELP